MGFIHKIKKNSITILPVTVADAVIMNDKDNGNLTEHLKKLGDDVDTLKSWFDVDEAGNIHTKDNRGFYSESFISAGGKSTTEGGGGTGGGLSVSQMWESLQNNNDTFKDRLINVAHIPTLTTGKISDFVSATQAIADNAVANKADKDKVVDLTSNQTISGAKTFRQVIIKAQNHSPLTLDNTDPNSPEIGVKFTLEAVAKAWVGYTENTGVYFYTYNTSHRLGLKVDGTAYVDKNTIYHTGNLSPVTIDAEQTITGVKTFSNLKVSNTNLVTNLNADMVDGYDSSVLFTGESGYGVDVNAPHPNKESGPLLYKISSNCTNIPPNCTDGVLVHFNRPETDTAFQLVSNYVNSGLYFRSGNLYESSPHYLYNKAWKQLAFTNQLDNYLPITGGTLTGALTVNAPINNTGALKLLGASEVSSTGMAVGAGAKALGSNSRSLSEYSHAGLRTGNSNYPSAIISPYDLLPFTVNGETIYGTPIKANSSLTYKYNGISYTVENTTNYTQVLVLISVGSDFVAGVTHPLNKCALTYSKGYSLGSGQKIHAISELSDTVRAITIYTLVSGSTDETYFINNFVISNSDKFYTYKGVSLSTQSGYASVASGVNSVASGDYSVASGDSSVASGVSSVASGYASVASGAYSVASGYASVASGAYSVASGYASVASRYASVASGYASVASHESSKVFATRGISGRAHQTVIGSCNEIDTSSLFVIGAGSNEQSRKNVFTVEANGNVRMGNRLHIGVGGKNEVYFTSDFADQLYVHTSAGVPFLIEKDFVRRGISTPNTTLGTDQYKWFNVFTEALKIADANLTYDTGTLTIDKALKTTSTLTATQGEFSNYIKIGNATISWNPKGYLVIDEGLASHKFISAGGIEETSTITELRQRIASLEAQLISLTNKE